MLDFPRTIIEFQHRFGIEEDCEKYLFDCRWPDGFICPRCEYTDFKWISGREALLRCRKCNYQVSLTAGTIMHRSKQPLTTWFWAAYLVTTQTPGMSAMQFQRQLGLRRYETAFNMLHKLRSAMVRSDRDKIHGVVEVDETYVGGYRPGKEGRGAYGKVVVVGAIEVLGRSERYKRAGRLRLKIAPNAKGSSLIGFIKNNVEEESWILTDDFAGYDRLDRESYVHQIVEPKQLGRIHKVFGNLKAWLIGTHHGVSHKHLQAYLNEFVFRHNRRKTPMAAFQSVLGIATTRRAPTYRELYDVGRGSIWTHPNPWG